MTGSNRHIIGLDIVRFCAALMVTLFHLAYWSWAPTESLTRSVTGGMVEFPSMAGFTWFGWVGVEIFFVISGFVISYSAAGASPVSFLRSRVLRLYPAGWICATATLAVVLMLGRGNPGTAGEYARAMTLWIAGPWIDGVYWTLGIEIVFYAVIFLTLCLGRFGSVSVVLSVMALASAMFWGGLAVDRALPGALPAGFLHDLLASQAAAFLLLRHGCFFALGGMLWLWHSGKRSPWGVFVTGLCLVTGMVEILDTARDIVLPIGDHPLRRLTACAVWLSAVACMAWAISHNLTLHRMFGKSASVIKILGLMTYPLYLVHDIIGAASLKTAFQLGAPPLAALALAVASVLTLSWAITRFLEPPVRARLRDLLSGPRRPVIHASGKLAAGPHPN